MAKTLSPEKITEKLQHVENEAREAARAENQKMEISFTMNGKKIRCTATPHVKGEREPYTLFYLDEKRKSRKAIPGLILST